jgi:hypothetical protein
MSVKRAISLPSYVSEIGEEIAKQKFGGNFSALVCYLISSSVSMEAMELKLNEQKDEPEAC